MGLRLLKGQGSADRAQMVLAQVSVCGLRLSGWDSSVKVQGWVWILGQECSGIQG